MKKFIAGLVIMFVFALTVPLTVNAQTCRSGKKYKKSYASKRYNSRNYSNRRYQTRGYVYQKPSFYQRHRNLINIGLGAGGGALVGGLLKGKRGAGYGALIGAGSGALYTYALKPKKKRTYRYR